MKIVQLVMARQYRGAEIFAAQLSTQLVKTADADVSYISLYESPEQSFSPAVKFVDLSAKRGGLMNIALLRKLGKQLEQIKPEIVQANAGDTLKYAVLARIVYGLDFKIVFRNASTISKYLNSSLQRIVYRFLFNRVDFICSVSETSRNDLIHVFPFCKNKIQVIPNGVEFKSFQRRELYGKSKINILHVGGFTFEKNHQALLRIFKLVKESLPGAKLFLIGDGPLKGDIENEVRQAELGSDVFLLGSRPDVLDYIASADVLVLPSRIEGMPGVILEAMYCRTPVVAFDVGGIAEIVRPDETGWLVPANDENLFAAAVTDTFQNTGKARMLYNGYKLVAEKYDNASISQQFFTVYKNLINK